MQAGALFAPATPKLRLPTSSASPAGTTAAGTPMAAGRAGCAGPRPGGGFRVAAHLPLPEGSGEPQGPEGSGEPQGPEGSGEPQGPEGSGEPQGPEGSGEPRGVPR